MRTLVVAFAFFCSSLLQAQAAENLKEVEPTLEVKKAFEKDFPKVVPVWRQEFNGEDKDQLSYEADFTMNNNNLTAVYNALGTFKVLQIEMKQADIPAKISSYMA